MTQPVDVWYQQVLWPLASLVPLEEVAEVRFSEDSDALTDFLVEGDDFAFIAKEGNEERVEYYILCCTRPKMLLERDTVNDYGFCFDAHSMVVFGHHYRQLHSRGSTI